MVELDIAPINPRVMSGYFIVPIGRSGAPIHPAALEEGDGPSIARWVGGQGELRPGRVLRYDLSGDPKSMGVLDGLLLPVSSSDISAYVAMLNSTTAAMAAAQSAGLQHLLAYPNISPETDGLAAMGALDALEKGMSAAGHWVHRPDSKFTLCMDGPELLRGELRQIARYKGILR